MSENISKYAVKRDMKLPSHVAASHAAPPRYLSPDDIVPQNKIKRDVSHTVDEPAAKRTKPEVTVVPTPNYATPNINDDSCAAGICKPRDSSETIVSTAENTDMQEKPMYGRGQVHAPSVDTKAIAKNLKMAPKKLIKAVGMAIKDWNMIEEV